MGKKTRTGVLKRQREVKKAEKAALKREKRMMRDEEPAETTSSQVATADDLAGYGFPIDEPQDEEAEPLASAAAIAQCPKSS